MHATMLVNLLIGPWVGPWVKLNLMGFFSRPNNELNLHRCPFPVPTHTGAVEYTAFLGRTSHCLDPHRLRLLSPPPDEISGFRFKERVFIADFDEFSIARTALVRHAGQVRVTFLAVFSHDLQSG